MQSETPKHQNTKTPIKKNGLFLIGLGMTKNSLTAEALQALKNSDKIYLENYTVNFPYKIEDLEKNYQIKIQELDRQKVEDESILEEAKEKKISLLVYGDSLSATTHMQLILECKTQNIPYKIFHNASILTTIAETGLSLYKFGKTTSMPNWSEHTNKPTSFMSYIKQNQSIEAHTLILTDIGLEIKDAISQLEESSKKENTKLPGKIIAISKAGTQNQKIFYDTPKSLASKTPKPQNPKTPQMQSICMPFCLVIPSALSHTEKEALEIIK